MKRFDSIGHLCDAMLDVLYDRVKHWRGDIAYDIIRLHEAALVGERVEFRWLVRETGTYLIRSTEVVPEALLQEASGVYAITYTPGEGYAINEEP